MADNKKNIDQLINESFQNTDFDFDDSSWGDVKNKLDTSTTVDKVVYSALNPKTSQLPDGAWEDMNDELDIETVWKRLEKRPKRKPIIFWWKIAGIAIFLSLITYQLNNNYALFNKKEQIVSGELSKNITVHEGVNKEQTVIELSPNTQFNNVIKSSDKNTVAYVNIKVDKIVNTSGNKYKKDTELLENSFTVKNKIGKIKPQEIKLITINIDKNNIELADYSEPINIPTKNSKLTLGIVSELNNTWISDVETRLGHSKNSLIYNDFSIVASYGVYFDYNITQRLMFSSEIFVHSLMQTKNNLYKSGNLTKKETGLEYVKSTFSLSKGISVNKLIDGSFLQFSGGVYFSYLKRSVVKYDNVITKINSDYKLFDYGVKVGVFHDIYFNRIKFSYGLHTTYGLNNVFGGEDIPSYLNHTRNISYGLNIKLGYRL